MTFPSLVVEFSPGEGPFDTASWVDISSRVLEASWQIGRDDELEPFPPGEATIVLRNDDRLFDPEYAAGTYFGLLVPRVPFRVRATHNAVTYDLFTGFVEDGWEQAWFPPDWATCTVRLVDMLGVIAGATLPGVFEAAVLALSPVGYWPLTSVSSGGQVADLGSGRNPGELNENPSTGQPELFPGLGPSMEFSGTDERIDVSASRLDIDIWHCTVMAVIATVTAAESGTYHTIFGQFDGNTPNYDVLSLYVASDGTARLEYVKAGSGFDATSTVSVVDGEPHLLIAQSNIGEVTDYGVAVDSATLSLSGTTPGTQGGRGVAIGGTPFAPRGYSEDYFPGRIGHVAVWGAVLTSVQRQTVVDALACLSGETADVQIGWALDQVGVPAGTRDLDVGTAVLGAARAAGVNALGWLQQITAAEQGFLYVDHAAGGKVAFRTRYSRILDTRSATSQAIFTDDTGALPAGSYGYRDLRVDPNGVASIINQVDVNWNGGTATVEDTTSVAAYGPQGRTLDVPADNPNVARSAAEWLIYQRKDPKVRVRSLDLFPTSDSEYAAVLGQQVGDRVTVERHPQGVGTQASYSVIVEGIRHRVLPGRWEASLHLSEAPDTDSVWVWGTSLWGSTKTWG